MYKQEYLTQQVSSHCLTVQASTGSSAGTPSKILNSPAVSIYNTDFLGKKCSKSQVKALLIFGVSIATAILHQTVCFFKIKRTCSRSNCIYICYRIRSGCNVFLRWSKV